MECLYYKSKKGNFGDDLNPWLWPQIFPHMESLEGDYFLGIGSILHDANPHFKGIENKKKIVFGTGIRPSQDYNRFSMDTTWDVKFLRGPLSANYLGKGYNFISDAAYALRQINAFSNIANIEKKYEVSIMPYFNSMEYFDWEKISATLGYNFISPYSENGVEHTLKEIAASKYVISEAMHGAILSDILRVPWHRFVFSTPYTEGERVSDFKWNDWMNSIDIFQSDISYVPFYKKTKLHQPIRTITNNTISANFFIKSHSKKKLIESLSGVKNFTLSSDTVIKEIDAKIYEEINCLSNNKQ